MSTEYWHSVIAVATLISINIKQICYPAKYSVTDDDNFRFSSAISIDTTQQQQELVIAVATLISIATIALWYHTVFGIQNIEVQISLHPHLLFRMGSVDEDSKA
ncbi:hypothetical protein OUZ56_024364 [Daphnia magna]|uniref:Uncharacterized protein n=1 Tax=Daphnia magna TaxID=35525 RepID=A0ABR0B0N5_9CRUS|nr:hypothetical protein OUZ56_024364 [Daphnia magna]